MMLAKKRSSQARFPLAIPSRLGYSSDNSSDRNRFAQEGRYDDGALFTVTSAIRTDMPDTAWIYGTGGSIRMPVFWKPESAFISRGGSERQITCQVPQQVPEILDEGYQYEIRHVNDCLRRGLTESPLVTHAMTGSVLQMCDEIRAQWGLVYPFEKRSP